MPVLVLPAAAAHAFFFRRGGVGSGALGCKDRSVGGGRHIPPAAPGELLLSPVWRPAPRSVGTPPHPPGRALGRGPLIDRPRRSRFLLLLATKAAAAAAAAAVATAVAVVAAATYHRAAAAGRPAVPGTRRPPHGGRVASGGTSRASRRRRCTTAWSQPVGPLPTPCRADRRQLAVGAGATRERGTPRGGGSERGGAGCRARPAGRGPARPLPPSPPGPSSRPDGGPFPSLRLLLPAPRAARNGRTGRGGGSDGRPRRGGGAAVRRPRAVLPRNPLAPPPQEAALARRRGRGRPPRRGDRRREAAVAHRPTPPRPRRHLRRRLCCRRGRGRRAANDEPRPTTGDRCLSLWSAPRVGGLGRAAPPLPVARTSPADGSPWLYALSGHT